MKKTYFLQVVEIQAALLSFQGTPTGEKIVRKEQVFLHNIEPNINRVMLDQGIRQAMGSFSNKMQGKAFHVVELTTLSVSCLGQMTEEEFLGTPKKEENNADKGK